MDIRLPPQALGASPDPDHSSPLAKHLKEVLEAQFSSPNPTGTPPASALEGAFVAAQHPFDADETFRPQVKGGLQGIFDGGHWTLLEGVLALGQTEAYLAPKRDWPATLEGFDADLLARHEAQRKEAGLKQPALNGEWLGAVLVAGGCSPWKGADGKRPTKDLPGAMRAIIQKNYVGLLERSLSLPDALSAQQTWDAIMFQHHETVAEFLVEKGTPQALKVLLDQGARPSSDRELATLLWHASEEAFFELRAHCPQPLDPKLAEEVLEAWKGRLDEGTISARTLAKVRANLLEGIDPETAYVQVQADSLLSHPWGVRPNGSAASAYDFMTDHDPSTLVSPYHKPRGQGAGQWSLLAAAAFARIRQARYEGALGWGVGFMIEHPRDARGQRLAHDFDAPRLKGSLKEALGFEWKKGVRIDGVVALSLLGQRAMAHGKDPIAQAELDKLEKDWRDFGLAAGIEDVKAWAVDNAQAAADFTLEILKKPSLPQAKAFLSTWSAALDRCPEMARAIEPHQAARLIQALSANFRLLEAKGDDPFEKSQMQEQFEQVSRSLFPDLFLHGWPTDVDPSLKGALLHAQLVMALTNPKADGLELMERHFAALPAKHHPLFELRIKAYADPLKTKEGMDRLEGCKMHHILPEASKKARVPGRRF